jgi:hypothetical protein
MIGTLQMNIERRTSNVELKARIAVPSKFDVQQRIPDSSSQAFRWRAPGHVVAERTLDPLRIVS